MSVGSFALRVLLGLCLLGNGTVAAAMHAPSQADPAAIGMMELGGNAGAMEAPCHGGGDDPMPENAGGSHDEPGIPDDSPAPDCCDSDACRCACVHLTPLAPAMATDAFVPGPHRGTRALPGRHASPTLAHPIRPPIG